MISLLTVCVCVLDYATLYADSRVSRTKVTVLVSF